jgi:hypothetical protein
MSEAERYCRTNSLRRKTVRRSPVGFCSSSEAFSGRSVIGETPIVTESVGYHLVNRRVAGRVSVARCCARRGRGDAQNMTRPPIARLWAAAIGPWSGCDAVTSASARNAWVLPGRDAAC